MASNPLVSICIPTYKQADYIVETIQSCLSQSYTNLELIVVDDYSQDETSSLVKKIQALDQRLSYVENKSNLGLAKNWNLAMSLATGDLIKIVCGDDLLDPLCIEKQVEALQSIPELRLVCCGRKIVDSSQRQILTPRRTFFLTPTDLESGIATLVKSGTNIVGEPMCGLFRRGNFQFSDNLPYMIDLDFWMQIWATGPIMIIPEPYASFRIHKDSLTSKLGLKQFREYVAFSSKLRKKYPKYISASDFYVGVLAALAKSAVRNLFLKIVAIQSWFFTTPTDTNSL